MEVEKWVKALFHVSRDWDDAVLEQIFIPEVLGKKINNIFDNQLRPIRDKIAHGILDSGAFLLLDKVDDRQPCFEMATLPEICGSQDHEERF